MIILGIETSCDDTSVAIVRDGCQIMANLVSSQHDLHREYGGIFPELASRRHLETLLPLTDRCLAEAKISLQEVDLIAVTTHPGLIGSLLTGINAAKTIAYGLERPLVPVSHLKAHFYSLKMSTSITYPFIGLLISGGHTLLALCHSPLDIEVIGTTLDDAVGECFDKIAKHFKMGYPGGHAVEKLASEGNEHLFDYPIITIDQKKNRYHFSFSGLKTAVIHQSEKYLNGSQSPQTLDWTQIKIADVAASFQRAVLKTLLHKTVQASRDLGISQVGICGGVAANQRLRKIFYQQKGITAHFPDLKLSTDNAGMIAGLAFEIHKSNIAEHQNPEIHQIQAEAKSFKSGRVL